MRGYDLGPLFPSRPETVGGFSAVLLASEMASVAPVQQTSDEAIFQPSSEASPDNFCLIPQPVLPNISSVETHKIHLHQAVRASGCNPTAVELEPVRQNWDTALSEPLVLTRSGTLIDGTKRWVVAQERGIATLPCVILAISDNEALDLILAHASAKNWWNRYRRICVALTLEEALRKRARENQRAGGRKKDPSTLTEAQQIDVRREIARKAGASTGSVTKVKQTLITGSTLLKQEAQRGAISIDAAFKISKFDHGEQKRQLGRRFSERRGKKRAQDLARAAARKSASVAQHPRERFDQIRQLLDEITRSGRLVNFRDPVRELLAQMERELNVCDSNLAKPRISESAGGIAQAGSR